ncbi:alpha/beta-hydrolase [Thozetella sp. PMI_491]|nr:alpha/beta-hydrolase [Thozetella sp. PMI_491]
MLFTLISVALLFNSGVIAQTTGCGMPSPITPLGKLSLNQAISTDNGTRMYRVYVPPNYDQNAPTPLIFSFHGAGKTDLGQAALDGLNGTIFNPGYIVIYPMGVSLPPSWEVSPGITNIDDIGFVTQLLDLIESEFCIDTNRIFATGKSDGGGMVGLLACDPNLSARFAAFAPVSGAYYNKAITDQADCDPQTMPIVCNASRTNIPFLAFHGGNDTTIPYEGGFRPPGTRTPGACFPSLPHYMENWALMDGLSTMMFNVSIPKSDNGVNITSGDGMPLVKLVYDGDNIPHDWPSTVQNNDNGGANLAAFDATSWIVGFFNSQSLN